MLRSLYSGVTGMKSFQTKMDVVSNNIANVNTIGFKAGRASFQDMLSQTISSAQSPKTYGLAGINPKQIGLGVKVGAIDTIMTEGPLQATNREMDFAIQGEGFFILSNDVNGNAQVYSRDGAFYTDYDGNLVNSSGLRVLGAVQDPPVTLESYLENQDDLDDDVDLKPLKIFKTIEAADDGKTSGDEPLVLQSYTIDNTGLVIGVYSDEDGVAEAYLLGQIAIATFNNPGGLEKAGDNTYNYSENSGNPEIGMAGQPGYGIINSGFLEGSNVDLATEFTEMIITSRAYQANSRSITTSDEMLQELINLKR